MLRAKKLNNISDWNEIIYQSVTIKNAIVKADPTEMKLRKKLNFGHTVGHATESLSLIHDATPLLHGEAVAIGMICESYLSHLVNGLSRKKLDEITSYINSVFPPYNLDEKYNEEVLKIMLADKKNDPKGINFSLLKNTGSCLINKYCTPEEILKSLDYYRKMRYEI